MAETRNSGGKKAKAKAKPTPVAAETPAPSPSVTTRSAASGKKANNAVEATPQAADPGATAKPKGKGKGKGKTKTNAPVVAEAVVETESPPSRKKKKRKRVHKRKGSDAGALAEVAHQHEESPEPPMKKQNVKKATEGASTKKTAFTTPIKAASSSTAATSTPPTEPKNTRSRNKKKGNSSDEKQGELKETEKPESRRVVLAANVETPVSTPQRGRLTRAAAAAAATLEATTTPVKSTASASASDQSPPSSSKPKKKRKRSRQGRRDSVEPSPAAEGVDDKPATDSHEQKAITADSEEEKTQAVALSPVKPKKTIISLVKVKASRLTSASEPETASQSVATEADDRHDEEEKEEATSLTQSPPELPMEAEGEEQIDDEDSSVDQDEITDEAEQYPEPRVFEDAPLVDQLVDEQQVTEDEGEHEDVDRDVEDEEEEKEDSDLDVDATMEDDTVSHEHKENELSKGSEAEGDEDMQAELAEIENVTGGKEDLSETEDDESISEAKDDEAGDIEEQAVGAEEDVDEGEAFEEEAYEDEAYRDDAEMQSVAVDFFMAQHPVEAPSAEYTDSDDEQRLQQSGIDSESDGEQRQEQSDSDSESDDGFPAQQASFSDSEVEEEEFQPGMGHYRFSSSPEPSNVPASGSPEVIELSDSDSDDDDESDAEAQHASDPRDTTVPTSDDHQQDEEQSEEHEEEEIDEEEEGDEDKEEARWNGDHYEFLGPHQSTVDPATRSLTETPESDVQQMEVSSGFNGWNQQTSMFGDDEEAKAEEDTEDEDEQVEDDESADEVVEVASDQEEKDEEIDNEDDVHGDGELTPSPFDAPQGQHSNGDVLEAPIFLTKPGDHEGAGQIVAPPVPSVTHQDHSIASPSTAQEPFALRVTSLQSHDESVPATTSAASAAIADNNRPSKQLEVTPTVSDKPVPATNTQTTSPAKPVYAYTTVPSRQLLESVLSGSPRATVASLTRGALSTPLPVRSQSQPRTWGPSFGGASVDTNAPVTSSAQVEASPLSSWFFAKGPANFKKRVVMPRVKESSVYGSTTPGSPRHRVGSPRPLKKPRLEADASEKEETAATRTDNFVQRLLDTSSWRSWYGSGEVNQLLDPPLPAAMIKRLGGEAALAMFSSPASDQMTQLPSMPTAEEAEIPKKRRHALSALEEAIQEEKKKARAFDQELLLLLQGKTLTGKELADEFASLLAATTK